MVPESCCVRDALFLAGDDVERQDRQHRAVHGHRDAHLVQRDAVEQGARVEDGVDRHPGHADVAAHARVVGVVAAVGGEIEGHRKAHLPGRQVAAIEGVGLLGRGEAGVLPNGPRIGGVHGRVGAAHERRQPGKAARRSPARAVARAVAGLERMASVVSQAGSTGARVAGRGLRPGRRNREGAHREASRRIGPRGPGGGRAASAPRSSGRWSVTPTMRRRLRRGRPAARRAGGRPRRRPCRSSAPRRRRPPLDAVNGSRRRGRSGR